ncbi:copine-8-like isoform X2 [Haemaphysalis longicornis]
MDKRTSSCHSTRVIAPATQVEISVSCRRLKNADLFSKSDPMCVLYTLDFDTSDSNGWQEVARTETICDCLNPDFVTKFSLEYRFEECRELMFKVYDVDSESPDLREHDFLGQATCTLGELVANLGKQTKYQLWGLAGEKLGAILLTVDEVVDSMKVIDMQWKGSNLDKKDMFGKSDPFLTFYRATEDYSFTVVFRSEVIKNTLNPTWQPFTIRLDQLSGGDDDRTIKVECYDWDWDGSHDLIGEFYTDVRTLSKGPGLENKYELINPKKKAEKKNYTNSGVVELVSFAIREEFTFLDYISGGMQMHFTVAVDFSSSNGEPKDPTSLHFLDPERPNAYMTAIQAVGEVIQDYDSDKRFPALGFGARLPPDGRVSHEFFLNGSETDPDCVGVEGVLESSRKTLQRVQLSESSNLSPVIRHVAKLASSHADGKSYFVLLIITDGGISDMKQTRKAIVDACALPMSIVIVGVGNCDFSDMKVLDGDERRLSSGSRQAKRDIVQFVPFNEFIPGGNCKSTRARLAKEVLAEIPGQVTSYMAKNGIKPG